MTATPALTTDLQRQVLLLEDDLRARLAADPQREGRWKQEHQRAQDKERTAASWVAWRDDRITQAAVAWVLTTRVHPVLRGQRAGRRRCGSPARRTDGRRRWTRSWPTSGRTQRTPTANGSRQRSTTWRALPATKALVERIRRCTWSRRPVTR